MSTTSERKLLDAMSTSMTAVQATGGTSDAALAALLALGRTAQDYVRGDGVTNTYTATATRLDAFGLWGASAVKKFWIPTTGKSLLFVPLRPSLATGSPLAKLYPVLLDGVTAPAANVNGDSIVQQVALTGGAGWAAARPLILSGFCAPWCVLELSTGAAEDLRFLASGGGVGEWSAL